MKEDTLEDKALREKVGLLVAGKWPKLLLSGEKTIETRTYPLPDKYLNKPIYIIEDSESLQQLQKKATVAGIVTFSGCFAWKTKEDWAADADKHCVKLNHEEFGWNDTEIKYGWRVSSIKKPPLIKHVRVKSRIKRSIVIIEPLHYSKI
mmetsp:Transcript_8523/g.10777  ORF Transcript_8523/g.10777 Transcript_8523/m.10777 type:complete len:149 (+) Transcript_8523:87-533(+)